MTKEKSQAELEIEALAEVFNIATTGFEEFYKQTKESAKLVKGQYGGEKFAEKVKGAA